MTTRDQEEILLSLLGEGFHTAFRKAVGDSRLGFVIHQLISELDGETWHEVLKFTASGLTSHLELMSESAKLPEDVPPGHPDYVWLSLAIVNWTDDDGEIRYGRIARKVEFQEPGPTVPVRPRRASRRRGEPEVIDVRRTRLRKGWDALQLQRDPAYAQYKSHG